MRRGGCVVGVFELAGGDMETAAGSDRSCCLERVCTDCVCAGGDSGLTVVVLGAAGGV